MTKHAQTLTMEQIADVENFDPANVPTTPSQKAVDIMQLLSDKVFIISEYVPIKRYDEFIDILMVNMAEGFEHKEFRDHPVMYKFYNDKDEEMKTMSFRDFIINVIMWRPMMCIDPANLHDGLIIEHAKFSNITRKFIKEYFDINYIYQYKSSIPTIPDISLEEINRHMNEIMADTTFKLSEVSNVFNSFIGISTNIETFIDLQTRIPEFNEIMESTLDERMQPAEIEAELADQRKRIVDLIVSDDRPNMMKALVQPQSGLNVKQFGEMVTTIGLKPDDEGRTIPHPINTNFLNKGGLTNTADIYLKAISGRKSQIMNNEYMGKTGHLLILIAILTAGAKLSRTTMDCNTVNPIPMEIKSKTFLKKLHGRRYRYAGQRDYRIINAFKDEHLIGETVYVRSPVTCACRDGICRECYGELYYTNIDNNNTGIYSATKVMNPVVQGILSAKHFQTTNSSVIKFIPEFNKFFGIAGTDIVLADNIDDITQYSILIRRENIMTADGDESELDYSTKGRRRKKTTMNSNKSDEIDLNDDEMDDDDGDGMELTFNYSTTKFEVVKNLHAKTEDAREYIEFEDVDSKELFIHTDLITRMTPGKDSKGEYRAIDLEALNPEEFIFLVDVQNNELTKPMKSIQRVLNNKDHDGCSTYEELVNHMVDLLIASELDAASVHSEMIIRQLVKRPDNVLKRPNFERIIMTQDYQLLTVSAALKKNPSITTSLSTPYLKNQLVEMSETFEKDAPGIFDPLFRLTLDNNSKHDRMIRIDQ